MASKNDNDEPPSTASTSCHWQTLPPLPSARLAAASAAIDEHRLVVVGGYNETTDGITIAERYDSRTNDWTALPDPMPTPRSGCAAAFLRGKLFVLGGWDGNGKPTSTSEALDATNDAPRWETMAPMLHPRQEFAAVAVDKHVYVFGGRGGGCRLDSAERYDSDADRWEDLPPMPARRFGCAAAAIGSKIYVVGGRDDDDDDEAYNYLASVDVFDVPTGRWEGIGTVPDMSTARHECAAAAVGGRYLVVLGGFVIVEVVDKDDETITLDTTEAYDTVSRTWTELPAKMSTPRSNAVAAVLGGGDVAIAGGYDGENYLASVERVSLALLPS